MKFLEIFASTPDYLKLKFFNAKIIQNSGLQKEFIAFVHAENNNMNDSLSYDTFLELIHSTQARYQNYFEKVDIENPDWENYQPPYSGYIEEWEAYQLASEQEFEQILDGFISEAVDRINQQKADELTAMLIGLYEATQDAEIIDEICSFEDINEYLLSEHTNVMNALLEKIRLSAVVDNIIITSFELFFSYCDSEYPENPHFANYFEQLLTTLAEKSGHADRLLSIIDHSAVERQFLPELVLLLYKKSGNKDAWLQSALQFYRNSTEVAKQLLDYYFQTNKSVFVEIAFELYPSDKHLWAEFLQDVVTPQINENLYVLVFRQLTLIHRDIVYYSKIRSYLSEADLTNLLIELKSDKAFVVKILEVEERFEEIKTLVEQNPSDWDYAEMISPILTVYPEFCFNQIKRKTENTLQNNRGRSVYERIVSWLLLINKIPGCEIEKLHLVNKLYNYKPNLPALKDEMRKAGLVSKNTVNQSE